MDVETFLFVKNTFTIVFFSLVFIRLIVTATCKNFKQYDLILSIIYFLKLLVVLSYIAINYELFVWDEWRSGWTIILSLGSITLIFACIFYIIRHFRKWRKSA